MAAGIDRLLQDQELAQTIAGLRRPRQHHVYEKYLDIPKIAAEEANACAAAYFYGMCLGYVLLTVCTGCMSPDARVTAPTETLPTLSFERVDLFLMLRHQPIV